MGGGRRNIVRDNTFTNCSKAIQFVRAHSSPAVFSLSPACTEPVDPTARAQDWRANDTSCQTNQPKSLAIAMRLPAWQKYNMSTDFPCLPAHNESQSPLDRWRIHFVAASFDELRGNFVRAVAGNDFCQNEKDINICGADQLGCGKSDCYCDNPGVPADISGKYHSILGPNRHCGAD